MSGLGSEAALLHGGEMRLPRSRAPLLISRTPSQLPARAKRSRRHAGLPYAPATTRADHPTEGGGNYAGTRRGTLLTLISDSRT